MAWCWFHFIDWEGNKVEKARTIICSNQGRKGYDDPEKRRRDRIDAVCDIAVFLLNYCSRENIDLQAELNRTWNDIVSKRTLNDWEQHNHESRPEIGEEIMTQITQQITSNLEQTGQGWAEPSELESENEKIRQHQSQIENKPKRFCCKCKVGLHPNNSTEYCAHCYGIASGANK